MTGKLFYDELERSIKQLEKEVLEYVRKEKKFNEEFKLREYSHIKRTISLMKINEELEKEIKWATREKKIKASEKNRKEASKH
jgi:hypothetical protein